MKAAILLLTAVLAVAADRPQAKPDDLAFLAGHWQGTVWGGTFDEVWLAPRDGHVIGMFRFLKDGKLGVSEVFSLEVKEGKPVLYMRHFRPSLVAVEDKEQALVWDVMEVEPGKVVFDRPNPPSKGRLTYRRTGPDTQEAVLEREKDGQTQRDVFVMKRVR